MKYIVTPALLTVVGDQGDEVNRCISPVEYATLLSIGFQIQNDYGPSVSICTGFSFFDAHLAKKEFVEKVESLLRCVS